MRVERHNRGSHQTTNPGEQQQKPVIKRGPKHRDLPDELIAKLAGQGMRAKAIASELKREHGIIVSYKTIQRMLEGQRVMV